MEFYFLSLLNNRFITNRVYITNIYFNAETQRRKGAEEKLELSLCVSAPLRLCVKIGFKALFLVEGQRLNTLSAFAPLRLNSSGQGVLS